MDERNEKTLLLTGIVTCAGLCLNAILWRKTGSILPQALVPYFTLALAVALFSWLRRRLERRAQLEAVQEEQARREQAGRTLFEPGAEAPPLSAARSRRQFERLAVPGAALALAALECVFAWWLARAARADSGATAGHRTVAALLGGQAFVLFLLSRYMLALVRANGAGNRLLRGPAVHAGLCALLCFLAAAAALAGDGLWPDAGRVAALGLCALLALLAIESVAGFVWHMFRPGRKARGAPATPYESRIARLLADPASWTGSAAQALDYQFGFRVSDTWLARFFQKALLPLALFQLVLLYLLSTLVFLGPEEEGILERFGRPGAGGRAWQPGLHLKLPWPFETVRRFPAKRIQTIYVGFEWDKKMPELLLWALPHFRHEHAFLVASRADAPTSAAEDVEQAVPVNLLNANVPVEYLVTNVYDYAYRYAEPARVLEQAAYRAVSLAAVSRDMFDLMGPGQLDTSRELARAIQAEADRLGLGVQVLFVGWQGVHPPAQVADAFESVVGALEQKETAILEARAYARSRVPRAEAAGQVTLAAAEAYRIERDVVSAAEADRFHKQLGAYSRSPAVFRMRTYLQTLQDALAGVRKYVVTAKPASEVIQLRFQEDAPLNLFDLDPGRDAGVQ